MPSFCASVLGAYLFLRGEGDLVPGVGILREEEEGVSLLGQP